MNEIDEDLAVSFYREVVLELKNDNILKDITFFSKSADPTLETYWSAVSTRNNNYMSVIPRGGGESALRELGLYWAKENNLQLAKNIVPLIDLYLSIMKVPTICEDEENTLEFIYPLF